MIYQEEVRDLFSVPNDYCLAHCISADFGMGKGIVVEFKAQRSRNPNPFRGRIKWIKTGEEAVDIWRKL